MAASVAKPGSRRGDSASVGRLLRLLRPYTGRLVIAVVALTLLAFVNMALPLALKLLIDDVFPNQNWRLLGLILVGILACYLLRNALFFVSKATAVRVGENVSFTLRNRLFEHLQRMNLQFYRNNKPGQLSSRVMDDSFVVQSFIQDEAPVLAQAALRFACLVSIIYMVNWRLALASTLVLPLHLWAVVYFKRPIKAASRTAQEQLSTIYGNLIESFLAMEVVKSFTAEERERGQFQQAIDISRQSQLRSKTWHLAQKVVADLLIGLGTIALLGFGAWQVMKPVDPMQAGTFMAFFGLVAMLYPTVLELVSGAAKLTRATASLDRIGEMLGAESQEGPPVSESLRKPIRGEIVFEGVWFGYREGQPVLRNVNFEVNPGEVCAIVGPSGSGKTTAVSMLSRFIRPDRGRVLIDGFELERYDLRHLRANVGVAFQECFLFNSTVLENLRYARPDADLETIVQVARRAGAHEFIEKLPHGYDTRLGEQGVTLSRGQKQRITLTRAMLKDPRILVLDEATASIDLDGESAVIEQVLGLMRGKTTLMITHRPELLKHADRVVELVDGEVAFSGRADWYRHTPGGAGFSELGSTVVDRRASGPSGRGSMLRMLAGASAGVVAGLLLLTGAATPAQADLARVISDVASAAPRGAVAPAAEPAPEAPPIVAKGRFLPMPGLAAVELDEMLATAAVRLRAELGYRTAPESLARRLAPPEGVERVVTLVRYEAGRPVLLQLGAQRFASQPTHVWLVGAKQTAPPAPAGEGAADAADADAAAEALAPVMAERWEPNPDLEAAVKLLEAVRKSGEEAVAAVRVGQLSSRKIPLSYVSADRCLAILKSLGYATIEYQPSGRSVGGMEMIKPSETVDPKKLPLIMLMPAPEATTMVGGGDAEAKTFPHTSAEPLMELLVFYHPARPRQYSDVLHLVRETIDVAARQILIEAMVLEISETGLKQLGVRWQLDGSIDGDVTVDRLVLGRLPTFNTANDEAAVLSGGVSDIFGRFSLRLDSLIREGEAEILSRPSVLTLDNRQAYIRVGEDIPIATSVAGLRTGSDKLSFNFRYEPVGISLNVRPRVTAEGDEISMQIAGSVSAEVPGEDLRILDQDGVELVRAPRLSRRRVATYARIANNTPFIIGGLISKDITRQRDKVPVLGDIPLIKKAFRRSSTTRLKREVIIVITPYVLPETSVVARNLPKDEDLFDSFGNRLFRDAYRIRTEDVFDLTFLTQNPRLLQLRAMTAAVLRRNAELADLEPFSLFAGGRIPGEAILVFRQMYEVIKRHDIYQRVDPTRLIFFRNDESTQAGFRVQFLKPYLLSKTGAEPRRSRPGDDPLAALFEGDGLAGKAIAMTFTIDPDADVTDALKQPVPDVRLVDCADDAAWSRTLWALNQRDDQGRQRYTILIREPDDLVRLQRAISLKRTVELNASGQDLSLENFTVGRLLLMPDLKPGQVHLIDEHAAKYFFLTELYYPAVEQAINRAASRLLHAIRHLEATGEIDLRLLQAEDERAFGRGREMPPAGHATDQGRVAQ